MYQAMFKHINSDTIVAFLLYICLTFWISWMMLDCKHIICSTGFIEFMIFDFYATTKNWHAHQNVRLGKLVCKKLVSHIYMETVIELSIKPFENLFL